MSNAYEFKAWFDWLNQTDKNQSNNLAGFLGKYNQYLLEILGQKLYREQNLEKCFQDNNNDPGA